MDIESRTVLITGAARGIGRALAVACTTAGARVALSDLSAVELEAARAATSEQNFVIAGDVGDPRAVDRLVDEVEAKFGGIDMCFANAGIALGGTPTDTPDEIWGQMWNVNVMQHVWLARRLLPRWLDRGEGYFVSTASAAGLLTQIGSAPYSVTKHAAVAFAEWLSVTYGDRGVRVSCVAPMGVDTGMLDPSTPGALNPLGSEVVRSAGPVLAADAVAAIVLDAVRREQFMILPHPEVQTFVERKATGHDRWLRGMRRLQAAVTEPPS